jgi:hypothetical protein
MNQWDNLHQCGKMVPSLYVSLAVRNTTSGDISGVQTNIWNRQVDEKRDSISNPQGNFAARNDDISLTSHYG